MHSKQQGLRSTTCNALVEARLNVGKPRRRCAQCYASRQIMVQVCEDRRRFKACSERILSNGRDGVRNHHRCEPVALLCVCTRRSAGSVQAAARGTVNSFETTRTTKHHVQWPRGSSRLNVDKSGKRFAQCYVICQWLQFAKMKGGGRGFAGNA